MALAISTQELTDFARLLTMAGVTSIECNWRGFTCQFTEGSEEAAADALIALRLRIESIKGKDARKAFIERLGDLTKDMARKNKQPEAARAALH